MTNPNKVLSVLSRFPEGLWIRELARRVGVSPGTICNYVYGYVDSRGRHHLGVLQGSVRVERVGNGAVTIVKLAD